MIRRILMPLLLISSSHAAAVEIPAEIEACLKGNVPASTSVQSIELRARDRGNYEQVMHADVFWKRRGDQASSVMMHFSEPVDIRGARFLIKQQEPDSCYKHTVCFSFETATHTNRWQCGCLFFFFFCSCG